MRDKRKASIFLFLIVAAVVALDQWTKSLVKANLAVGGSISPLPFLGDFFRILHWKNTGAAFGIFQDSNLILTVLSVLIIGVLVWYYFTVEEGQKLLQFGLALAVGGAIGNLIDRVSQGYVTDFLSFGTFPIFNVGDSAVTVSVGLMILAVLLDSKKHKPELEDKGEHIAER